MTTSGLTIVHAPTPGSAASAIPLRVDRWTLAKTRWRGTAGDGREFGFDLHHPLKHGDRFADGYVIEQMPEPVLVIALPAANAAAELGWTIGNLHQPVQVTDHEIITAEDSGVKALLQQQHIHFRVESRVFEPLRSAVHGHHHHG